jgi:hypothetical protein
VPAEKGVAIAFDDDLGGRKCGSAAVFIKFPDREERTRDEIRVDMGHTVVQYRKV